MLAYIFPGQGSQYPGMGKDHTKEGSHGADMFAQASEILGYDLFELCQNGPLDRLSQTRYSQPAVFVMSCVMFNALKDSPDIAAGHSLGEYAALYGAGSFAFQDGVKIVATRAELMDRASRDNPGSMYAILGLPVETVEEAVGVLSDQAATFIANENAPEQIVITTTVGDEQVVQEVFARHRAKKVIRLAVSGPFHSPLMAGAADEFRSFLATKDIKAPRCPVLSNYDAGRMSATGDIIDRLARQLTSRVKWTAVMKQMAEMGADEFVEVGPGKVLQGLVRRNLPDVAVRGTDLGDRIKV